jgi:hypothetical protein
LNGQVESKPQIPEANPGTVPTATAGDTKTVSFTPVSEVDTPSSTTVSSLLPASDISIDSSSRAEDDDSVGGAGEELLETSEFSDIASKSPAGSAGADGFGVVNLRANPPAPAANMPYMPLQQPAVQQVTTTPTSNPEYKTIAITANPNELSSMGINPI